MQAQEDAQLLKSVVVPLEEEIKNLKEQLKEAKQQLKAQVV
jgi:multidrug resistance efflux pump